MTDVLEYDSYRRLVEVDADYGITVRQIRGKWLVRCGMCKHRRAFDTHARATAWATRGHLAQTVHQRNLGRIHLGGHLSVRRGYDTGGSMGCNCGVCDDCARFAQLRSERRAEVERARAALRPVAPLPPISWTSSPIGRRSCTRINWHDGRISWGTEYALFANGMRVDQIQLVALEEGGWLLNGRYMPTDADLVRSVA